MKKLYQYEDEYREALKYAVYNVENGCTLREFLELGFNNATLLNPFEEDTDKKDVNNIYEESEVVEKFTDKMLDVRVTLSSTYEDWDGFTCANIVLENDNDWKLFEKLEEF